MMELRKEFRSLIFISCCPSLWISISTSFVSSKSSEESIVEVAYRVEGGMGGPRWRKNGVQLKRELTSSWSTKRRNYIENLVEILRIAIDCGRGKESRYRGPCSVSLTWEGKNSQWTIVMNFYPSGSTCWAKKFCLLTGWIESMAAMRRTPSTYLPAKATRPPSMNRSRSPFF